jgi:hypothetical protein
MDNKEINLIFTGDLCCNNGFAEKLENRGEIISEKLKEKLGKSDYVIFNFEGSSFGNIPADIHNYNLKNSPLTIPYLKSFCNPIFNIANNHTMDYGAEGLLRTIELFEKNGVHHLGAANTSYNASQPHVITLDDFYVNIWGIHAYKTNLAGPKKFGLNGLNNLRKIKSIIKNQKGVHKNIICIHGGEEYTFYPMPYKRKFLIKLARYLQPDVIICHHSHTVQGIEKIGETQIFYSLGNFMFDIPPHAIYEETNQGLLVDLKISRDNIYFFVSGSRYSGFITDSFEIEDDTNLQDRLNLKNYKKQILYDAYRVVFKPKKRENLSKIDKPKRRFYNPFKIHRLIILKGILTDHFLISLYYNALKYRFFYYANKR